MEKELIALQNNECQEYGDFSEAERLLKENERAHRVREHEYGGDVNVQSKIRMFESRGVASRGEVSQEREAKFDMFARVAYRKLKEGSEGNVLSMSPGKSLMAPRMTGISFLVVSVKR